MKGYYYRRLEPPNSINVEEVAITFIVGYRYNVSPLPSSDFVTQIKPCASFLYHSMADIFDDIYDSHSSASTLHKTIIVSLFRTNRPCLLNLIVPVTQRFHLSLSNPHSSHGTWLRHHVIAIRHSSVYMQDWFFFW